MSVYSTMDVTREEVIGLIEERVMDLDKLSDNRLIEVLESLCQSRDYDEIDDDLSFNNFYLIK